MALSGGVDSAAAAAFLAAAGDAVLCVWLRLPSFGESGAGDSHREDARRAARQLGLEFTELDCRDWFEQAVIEPFCREYAQGRTPNPCVRCNSQIKFGRLLEYARARDRDFVATGHYARAAVDERAGRVLLLRGLDPAGDQSYFLYGLSQDQLAHALFPVGGLTKAETRRRARAADLDVSRKRGSRDICFLPAADYRLLLKRRCPEAFEPGPILDGSGKTVGRHAGIATCTVGQRRGLGIALGRPAYVLAIDRPRNAIVVGPRRELLRRRFTVEQLNWIAFDRPPAELRTLVRTRHRGALFPAVVRRCDADRVEVLPDKPQPAAAAGQSAVFYDGDRVLGGGIAG